MVGANTFRAPTLTAKLATTLDHISGGRAILGIGGAWFGEEHEDFGLDFGSGFPERLRWLGEALPIMRGMLDGTEPTARGDHYHAQGHAQPAGAGPGPPADLHRRRRREGDAQAGRQVRRHEQRRRRHRLGAPQGAGAPRALRDRSGRDPSEIERTTGVGTVVIRDNRAEAERIFHEAFDRNRVARHWEDQPVGTPEDVAEKLAPYLEIGYRHLISGFPANYDEESMTRFATEVRPLLENG